MKYKDISGRKFGQLTVLYKLHNYYKKDAVYWLCVCDCGNLTEVKGTSLRCGATTSCGCYRLVKVKNATTKHGYSNNRLHKTWRGILYRCYNKDDPSYNYYGGRAITICDEWLHDFKVFYNWAINNGYKESLTIDRIDVNGNYEPSNCRWVDMKIQSRNKRNNINYTIDGETHCIIDWCKILNLNYHTVYTRIHRGWAIGKALNYGKVCDTNVKYD